MTQATRPATTVNHEGREAQKESSTTKPQRRVTESTNENPFFVVFVCVVVPVI